MPGRHTVVLACSAAVLTGLAIGQEDFGPRDRPGLTVVKAIDMPYRGNPQFPVCDESNLQVTESSQLNNIVTDGSLLCTAGSTVPGHAFGRMHDLSGLTGDYDLACVTWGVEYNVTGMEINVSVYSDDDGDPTSGLSLLATGSGAMTAMSTPGHVTVQFPAGTAVPNGWLFVSMHTTNDWSDDYRIGANADGQTSPSWIKTSDGSCGVGAWTDVADIGYGHVHWVEAIELAGASLPDPCDEPLPACNADVSGPQGTPDNFVGVDDILHIISTFGQSGDGTSRPGGDCHPLPAGDCQVTVDDLLECISQYGTTCEPPAADLAMNELRTNHSGYDTNEYIEIAGTAGASLDGYSWIVIGDGSGDSPGGHLETIIDLDGMSLDENGYFSLTLENLFENSDPVTHMLVSGLTHDGSGGTVDLDLDDDGTLDEMPWDQTIDCLGLAGSGEDELLYCEATVGPDDTYVAVGGYRCPDLTGDWVMAAFNLSCLDTPGGANNCGEDDADGDCVPDCADNCDLYNPDQEDCNGNGSGDVCDLDDGTSSDCNANAIPDECESDCNGNGSPDDCDIADGTSGDCNANGLPDECEDDCNGNGIADECDIADGTSQDANGNGVPDECESSILAINEIHADPSNANGYADGDANGDGNGHYSEDEFVEIVNATGGDLYLGGWTLSDAVAVRHTFPDGTLLGDGCAIVVFGGGTPTGEFGGAIVQVASEGYLGLNNGGDTVTLADASGVAMAQVEYGGEGGDNQSLTRFPDVYGESFFKHGDVSDDGSLWSPGTSINGVSFGSGCGDGGGDDADGDGVPDDFDNCDLYNPDQADCNGNDIGDVCDLDDGTSSDCDGNGVPDECDDDCNENGVPDACDIADGTSQDENGNGIPDECEETAGGAWINELHYDNSGGDVDEMIEVVLLDGIDAATATVTLYNGSNGNPYGSSLSVGTDFSLGEVGTGYSIYSVILPANGLQNGAPDGMCLDIGGTVAEFISYEGTITAASGPAEGLTSTDIGVAESSGTEIGSSLGRTGDGGAGEAFAWTVLTGLASPGQSNDGQTITP